MVSQNFLLFIFCYQSIIPNSSCCPTHPCTSCSNSSCVKSPYTDPCSISNFNFYSFYLSTRLVCLVCAIVSSCVYMYILDIWGYIIMCKHKTIYAGRCPYMYKQIDRCVLWLSTIGLHCSIWVANSHICLFKLAKINKMWKFSTSVVLATFWVLQWWTCPLSSFMQLT